VLFHAGVSWLPGGYLGVDALFLLSGFLMTDLLMKESLTGRVCLLAFYARWIRRLLPAVIYALETGWPRPQPQLLFPRLVGCAPIGVSQWQRTW
jgi:hypothetical protein